LKNLAKTWLIVISTLLSLGTFSALAAPQGWSPLLEPDELEAILGREANVRVIHVTGQYDAGHIPGALHAPYAEFRGPQSNPGELPSIEALTTLVQKLGISADTPVVVVHQGSNTPDMGTATRVYWTLKSLGVQDLAVLNGGFAAWQRGGYPISTDTVEIAASNFVPVWQDTWRISADEIEQGLITGEAQVIDARPQAYFEGLEATASRAGTIPGATNLSFENWFEGNSLKSDGQLQSVLTSASRTTAQETVSFCNSGQLASINWFVMSEVSGMENVRLYAESIMEWANSDRPMANQPPAQP
jgi:thiosulfate/3-mercaptopyruvate sulfurtransferase